MFEEIEARAFHNLRGDIKALITRLIDDTRYEREKSEAFIDRKWNEVAEYHAGYADALDDVSARLLDIIGMIDDEVAKQSDDEDRKFSEYYAAEIAADEACSKQL